MGVLLFNRTGDNTRRIAYGDYTSEIKKTSITSDLVIVEYVRRYKAVNDPAME